MALKDLLSGTKLIMELNNSSTVRKIIELLLITLPIALLFSNIVSEIIIFGLIFIYFINQKSKNFFQYLKDPIIFILILFWLYLILNSLINFEKDPSFSRSIFFVRFPLYIISITFFINNLNISLNKVFKYWLIIIIIICIDLFFQFFTQNNLFGYEAIRQGEFYRLGGFMDDELKIANLIFHIGALVFSFFFSKNYFEKKIISLKSLFFLLFLIITVFITAERANFVTIISFVVIFIILMAFENKKFFFTMIILFSVLISIPMISNDNLSNRMTNSLIEKVALFKIEPNKNYLNKKSHYFTHYSAAYQIFKRNILFGVGLKNFRTYCNDETLNKEIDPIFHTKKCATHPHNFYFEILSEIGLIGFVLLLFFFVFLFFKVVKNFIITKNYFLILNSFIILVYFIPFMPRGSFFTNWNAIIFWTVVAFLNANLAVLRKPND
ncbi:oligosaccharide repeat unit polymerase [Candidatus Pelagibacter bacterium nBUS_32]|uniref:oligosaccharide repeat unit polymerase n=1 Tax=Candidatus Pelagibacter bacterium nBUS_32 TaxID=3374192 RepID=UPI003EBE34F8